MYQVLPESENTEEIEALFLSGLEQYKESQPIPDETEPVPSTVSFTILVANFLDFMLRNKNVM